MQSGLSLTEALTKMINSVSSPQENLVEFIWQGKNEASL